MLSRLAQEFADEIALHDWSDSPWRADRAGHQLSDDPPRQDKRTLSADEADHVRINVAFVVAQVLRYTDPNFDPREFAVACGVSQGYTHRGNGELSDVMIEGLRWEEYRVQVMTPGKR